MLASDQCPKLDQDPTGGRPDLHELPSRRQPVWISAVDQPGLAATVAECLITTPLAITTGSVITPRQPTKPSTLDCLVR